MIPPGKYRGCKRNISKTPGMYETDGCTLYSPQNKHPEFCSLCNCHVIHHRSEPDQVNPTPVQTVGGEGSGSGVGNNHHNGALVESCNQVHGELIIPVMPAIDLNKAPTTPLVRTRFTETQTNAMREYAERLGWSVASVGRSTIGQAELNNFCAAHGITRKQFADWVCKNKKYATNVSTWAAFRGHSSSHN